MTDLVRTLRQRQVGMERRAIRELAGLMRGADRPLCLIIEDVHTIGSPVVLEVFDYFLDSVPSGSHVVLTSRTVPSIRTARRLVAGEITLVGADDLAFTAEESVTVLRDALPHLDGCDLVSLNDQVRGWPAGLQLAVLHAVVGRRSGADGRGASRLGAEHRGLPDPGVPPRPSGRRTDLPPAVVGPRARLGRDGRLRPRADPFDGAATTAGEVGQRLCDDAAR